MACGHCFYIMQYIYRLWPLNKEVGYINNDKNVYIELNFKIDLLKVK